MFKSMFKKLSGGNSHHEFKFLENAKLGALTKEYINEMLDYRVDIDVINVNDNSYEGYTPLMHYLSSSSVNPEIIMYLITKGANVNAKAKYGHTPLHMSAYSSPKENRLIILQLLINKGADVHSKDSSGYTPLHNYVGSGFVEEVKLLLDSGAASDINHCGKDTGRQYWGFAPLHKAIFEARRSYDTTESMVSMVELLLEYNADPNLISNSSSKYTPLKLLESDLHSANYAKNDKWISDLENISVLIKNHIN